MKTKYLSLALLLCSLLMLCGCGKVTETEEAIAAIGEVTMDSIDRIEAAEALYNSLSDGQQDRVDNYHVLSTARKEITRMEDLIQEANAAIHAIGDVTLDSLPDIQAAWDAYEALKPDDLTIYAKASTIAEAEAQWLQLHYDLGSQLLADQDYEAARSAFAVILSYDPECTLAEAAKAGTTEALLALAGKQFQARDYEGTYYSLKEIRENYTYPEEAQALEDKLTRQLSYQYPQNGKVFSNTLGWGHGEFTVKAGNRDACVKLENVDDPSKFALFYVHANQQAKINVKDGSYVAKYATGEQWFDRDIYFGRDTTYTLAEDTMVFTTTREGGYIYYQTYSITLYTVVGGDLETSEIDPSAF